MSRRLLHFVLIIFLILPLLTSCGGGSAGTGSSGGGGGVEIRTLQGEIKTSDGKPLTQATVTILQTGESTQTDQEGAFSLSTTATTDNVDLLIEKGTISTKVAVNLQMDTSNKTTISVSIDQKSGQGSVRGVDIRAKIVGNCDPYFENGGPIRQANKVPAGTTCPLQVSMRAPRGGLPHRTFAIQFRRCQEKGHPWHTLGAGETQEDGIGKIFFKYFDDDEHCIYRILAPLNDNEIQPVEFHVLTFTYQQQSKK